MELMSPEQIELKKLQDKYEDLTKSKENLKYELEKIQTVYDSFEKKFVRKLSSRYRILDKLDYKLQNYKKSRVAKENFEKAEEFEEIFKETEERFKPMFYKNEKNEKKDIKSLYREIVKNIHPDRSRNEAEEKVLTDLMSRVNLAYKENDKDTMLSLYNGWRNNPESILDEDSLGDKLIKIIRLIYSKESEVKALQKEIDEIKSSELFQFKLEVDKYRRKGVDIIKEMASSLDKEIALKKKVVRFFELLEDASTEKKEKT